METLLLLLLLLHLRHEQQIAHFAGRVRAAISNDIFISNSF